MEKTTTHTETTEHEDGRSATLTTLAIVGFIALILIGIAIAIWSVRYVPYAVRELGSAAVGIFDNGENDPELEIIPGTIPFEPVATSTEFVIINEDNTATTPAPAPTSGTPTYTPPRTITVPVTVPPPAPYGKADLTVTITATGYCSNDRPSSFRESRDIPRNENGGFQFTVSNIGTNTAGRWDLTYELPTSPSLERTVRDQRELGPGDRMDYTLCFTEPRAGNSRDITVEVDSNDDVDESNERNNTDSAEIDIDD